MLPEFDESKYFLGNLCSRNHGWHNTGQTLRRLINRSCVECAKISKRKYNQSQHGVLTNKQYRQSLQRKEYEAQYRQSESRKAAQKRYNQSDKGKAASRRATAKRMQTPEGRARAVQFFEVFKAKRKTPEGRKLHCLEAKKYRSENLEARRDYYKQWRSSEQGRKIRRLNQRKREYRERSAYSSGYTRIELDQHLSRFGDKCAYCNINFHNAIDHFIAISKGGADCLSNLVAVCTSCNSAKHDSDPLEWFSSQIFYSRKQWREILRLLGKSEDNYNQIPLL